MRKLKEDLTGKTYNQLKVIGFSHINSSNGSMWDCECSCGELKKVGRYALISGKAKSCGCSRYKNLVGLKFGKLTVLENLGVDDKYRRYWLTKCDCGEEFKALGARLLNKNTKSCGCLRTEKVGYYNNLVGNTYSRLTVTSFSHNKDKTSYWNCNCTCGNTTIVAVGNLTSNHVKSCGCIGIEKLKKRSITHNMSKSSEYNSYQKMKARCLNTNNNRYYRYGGRGIKVCDRWLESFENFIFDMGLKPSNEHTIEREDNDGDYTPENCIWLHQSLQALNRSTTVNI